MQERERDMGGWEVHLPHLFLKLNFQIKYLEKCLSKL
jgi:hypothetical protein